jgi:para-aminobenzoate synthetase/4-amino-4-deoxychorismate lyase
MLQKVVLRDEIAGEWLIFTKPEQVFIASDIADVLARLGEAERCVQEGRLFAAGFLSYEAAPAFDPACVTKPRGAAPLVCLGLFREPERVTDLPVADAAPQALPEWTISGTREHYLSNIGRIKQQIQAGNTYQVNYTVRQCATGVKDPWRLFLATAMDAPYAAYIECAGHAVVSASPELFFDLSNDRLLCKPMKGTAARGMTSAEDEELRRMLETSAKDRAENVMIADMVRNDMGRIAIPGSVRAPRLYDIEKYRTVWQMTSTVTATTNASVCDIFRALFPSASVTGAPKVSSMRLIAELEASPRQVYTGAIGYLAPGRHARFSVAIRTALIDRETDTGVYGIGGGIVWDSDPADEFQECLNKARVLAVPISKRAFRLIETMLWTVDEGLILLDEHLDRLQQSADYFDFAFDRAAIEARLAAVAAKLSPGQRHRVRLLLGRDGEIQTEEHALPPERGSRRFRLALAAFPVDTRDPFLYHKTTRREVYERALAATSDRDDVLLWNKDGNITETTIGNVVVRQAGKLWTPPITCGLLAGTFRRRLLRDGEIEERIVSVVELAAAEAIFVINSVRGWIPCDLKGNVASCSS